MRSQRNFLAQLSFLETTILDHLFHELRQLVYRAASDCASEQVFGTSNCNSPPTRNCELLSPWTIHQVSRGLLFLGALCSAVFSPHGRSDALDMLGPRQYNYSFLPQALRQLRDESGAANGYGVVSLGSVHGVEWVRARQGAARSYIHRIQLIRQRRGNDRMVGIKILGMKEELNCLEGATLWPRRLCTRRSRKGARLPCKTRRVEAGLDCVKPS
jgi:hypothetical protein